MKRKEKTPSDRLRAIFDHAATRPEIPGSRAKLQAPLQVLNPCEGQSRVDRALLAAQSALPFVPSGYVALRDAITWVQNVVGGPREFIALELLQALGDDRIVASSTYKGELTPLSARLWRETEGRTWILRDVMPAQLDRHGVVGWGIVLPTKPVEQWLKSVLGFAEIDRRRAESADPPSSARQPEATAKTAGDATRLLKHLVSIMSEMPDDPPGKAAVKEQAEKKGFPASKRMFDREYALAVQMTGAHKWSKPGPKKSAQVKSEH